MNPTLNITNWTSHNWNLTSGLFHNIFKAKSEMPEKLRGINTSNTQNEWEVEAEVSTTKRERNDKSINNTSQIERNDQKLSFELHKPIPI